MTDETILERLKAEKDPIQKAVQWIGKLQDALNDDSHYQMELIDAMIDKFGHTAYEIYDSVTAKHGPEWDGSDPEYGFDMEIK